MIHRAIGAYVFDGTSIRKNIVISYNDEGTIVGLEPWNGQETAHTTFYDGLLMPAFVNAHCHLELSHLHKQIASGCGMSSFVGQVVAKRAADLSVIETACKQADALMFRNGIAVVGDISNADHSRKIKLESSILYHSFIECFGLDSAKAEGAYESASVLKNKMQPLLASVTAHAPYSMSDSLLQLVVSNLNGATLSIHNQESMAEQLLFSRGEGELFEHFSRLQLPLHDKARSAPSSLHYTTLHLPQTGSVLFVHNTVTRAEDLAFLHEQRPQLTTAFCLCPLSNDYITGATPPVAMLHSLGEKICIGTDSLASNRTLSILDEMKKLQDIAPEIALDSVLRWATKNGAEILQLDHSYGSLETDKKPGIVQLTPVDVRTMKLLPQTAVRRIV